MIRDWKEDDIERVTAISAVSEPEIGVAGGTDLEELMRKAAPALVAEGPDGITGFLICLTEACGHADWGYRWFRERYPRFAYIERVCVDPEARSRGIGAALYDELELRLRGSCPVMVCVVTGNGPAGAGAYRFHRRRGFQVLDRLPHPRHGGTVLLMEKPLP